MRAHTTLTPLQLQQNVVGRSEHGMLFIDVMVYLEDITDTYVHAA